MEGLRDKGRVSPKPPLFQVSIQSRQRGVFELRNILVTMGKSFLLDFQSGEGILLTELRGGLIR